MTSFLLNGQPRILHDIEPGRTVLEHLRLHERLTATKEGCAEGDCGACTIALGRPDAQNGLNFQAVNACIMLAAELDGAVIITAEGVANNSALNGVQNALVECHASQCGFCTPGFVMSLYAYAQNPPPANQREAIYDALSGNLCRCTGYRPIIDAAATLTHQPDPRLQNWRAALGNLPVEDDNSAPSSLAELDALLAADPSAKLLGGGTDLGVGIAKHGDLPASLISLRRAADLHQITETAAALVIGAAATYSAILPYLEANFPAFGALIRRIGSVQIRNLGTMGGNICNASPIGDSAPCLLALDAQLTLRSTNGRRRLPIDQFFQAYRKTALRPGEYLESIEIPKLQTGQSFYAYKIAKRFDQDISTICAAFSVTIADQTITAIRTGFGGMAATPARAKALEAALTGASLAANTFAAAAAAATLPADFTPLSDLRASADYRVQAAAGLITRLGAQLIDPETATDIWAL